MVLASVKLDGLLQLRIRGTLLDMEINFSLRFLRIFSIVLICFAFSTKAQDDQRNGQIPCDPLSAPGTSVFCSTPSSGSLSSQRNNCSEPSHPGTIAAYACTNARGDILKGTLNCSENGVWMSFLTSARSSLCNLEASIVNVQKPDVAVAFGNPIFTTPVPNPSLLQQDANFLTDSQKTALQLHNQFRKNHGVPFVSMAPLMNNAAQGIADFIATGKPMNVVLSQRVNMLHVPLNIETNWYLQQPSAPNDLTAVSNAVQSWYSGFAEYNWSNLASNLDKSNVLAFTRIIWKDTKFIGIGISKMNGITFVVALYTPGRAIRNSDPALEFQKNVLPFRVGRF